MKKVSQKNKNVSISIPNGTLIITNDKYLAGTDGRSDKTRMTVAIESNRKNELGVAKYTTSTKHGRKFQNNKGFIGHGDMVYTKDNNGNAIVIDGVKFIQGSSKRAITPKQANEIKRRNVKESKYRKGNRKRLRHLKNR